MNWPVELAWTKKRVRQLLIFSLSCSLKVKFIKKDFLETHQKFNFVTSRGQFTGKTWHKIFLKQFLADFKIIRDSIIMITVSPMCQMFIKKVKKQRARKFERISWNSNHQSPCEINCDLQYNYRFLKHIHCWHIYEKNWFALFSNKYFLMFSTEENFSFRRTRT